MYAPGDIFYKQFVVNNISGVATNADTVPWGRLNRNGLDDFSTAALVYVSSIDTGRYNVSGVVPSTYVKGNSINLTVSGVIGGLTTKSVFDLGMVSPVQHGLDAFNIENGVTLSQLFAVAGAAIAGSSTVNGNVITYYAVNNNATQRIVSTAISGARQSIIVTLP